MLVPGSWSNGATVLPHTAGIVPVLNKTLFVLQFLRGVSRPCAHTHSTFLLAQLGCLFGLHLCSLSVTHTQRHTHTLIHIFIRSSLYLQNTCPFEPNCLLEKTRKWTHLNLVSYMEERCLAGTTSDIHDRNIIQHCNVFNAIQRFFFWMMIIFLCNNHSHKCIEITTNGVIHKMF